MPRNSSDGSAAQNEPVCDGWKAQHRCCQGVLWALVHLCARARVCASSCRTCWIVPSVLQPLQTLHQRLKYLLPGARNLVVQVGKDPCLLGRWERSRAEVSWRLLETYKEATGWNNTVLFPNETALDKTLKGSMQNLTVRINWDLSVEEDKR